MKADFYSSFEEKFRGPRDIIKSRLEVYLPFIKPLLSIYPEAKTIDLGCGRGEWLELLNENGFSPYGVDFNENMLDPAKKMGLTVHCEDAIGFLKNLPEQSHVVVSAFHIVEHLPFDDVIIIVQEALRVLKPGGILIIETPNPENLVVGTSSFYLDPTHKNPIPPQLLAFLPEYYGFQKFKVLRLQEKNNPVDNKGTSLLDVLWGVSPDCAIVAQKNAEETILDLNQPAFEAEYGVTLEGLAALHDAARYYELEKLSVLLKESEADRAARLNQIEQLTVLLHQAYSRSVSGILRSTLRAVMPQSLFLALKKFASRIHKKPHGARHD